MKHLLHINARSTIAPLAVALLGVGTPIALGAAAGGAKRPRSAGTLALHAAPASRTIAPGSATRYAITIRGSRMRGTVALRLVSRLPGHASARFLASKAHGSRSTLVVTTRAGARSGSYRLRLRATSGVRHTTIAVTLKLAAGHGTGDAGPVSSAPFAIDGELSGLRPGAMQALDLSLTNPNGAPLSVTNLSVSARSVDAPRASQALPCTLADFALQQFSAPYPLIIPASSTRTLAALGIPSAKWPQVTMLDRASDQDGCKGASLALSYSGTGGL